MYYKWEKYDSFSDSWIPPSSRAENIKSVNLTFSVITDEDQGIYRCIVSNDDGHVISYDANIIVYGKLSFIIKGSLQWKNDLGLYFTLVLVMKIGMCDLIIFCLV